MPIPCGNAGSCDTAGGLRSTFISRRRFAGIAIDWLSPDFCGGSTCMNLGISGTSGNCGRCSPELPEIVQLPSGECGEALIELVLFKV